MLHLLHSLGEIFQSSRTKVKYVAFQVTAPTLEVGLVFWIWTLGFGTIILIYILIGLGLLPLSFSVKFFGSFLSVRFYGLVSTTPFNITYSYVKFTVYVT